MDCKSTKLENFIKEVSADREEGDPVSVGWIGGGSVRGVLGTSGIKKKRKNWRSRRGDGPVGCEKKQETAPRIVSCLGF